ncbi:3462_t:CDS:2, partial [Racocetra persica]
MLKYCLNFENTITLNDLERFSPSVSKFVKDILNAEPNTDLSTIVGFDEWAECKGISKIQKQVYSRSKENLEKLAKQICYDTLIYNRISQLDAIKHKLNKFGFLNFLKTKKVKIEQVKNYFYQEIITANDIIKKLSFSSDLNSKQTKVKRWLIEWIQEQKKPGLLEFCRLITGFTHPRHDLN